MFKLFKNFNVKNPEASTYLLAMAFAIEIGVAALAFYLGIMTATIGSDELDRNILNITMGPLLFGVVAIIELTRVPILLSIYRAKSFLWKIFGSIFLIIIMFLAFETLLVTFQMNGAMVTGNIDKTIIDKRALSEKVTILNNEIFELSSLNQEKIDNEYDRETNKVYSERELEIENIDKEIRQIELTIAQSTEGALGNKENLILNQKKELIENQSLEISDLKVQLKNKNDIVIGQITALQNENSELNSTINSGQPCTNLGAKGRIGCSLERKYLDNISSNQDKIKVKENIIDTNNLELQENIEKTKSKFQNALSDMQNQLSLLADEKINIQSKSQNKFESKIQNLQNDRNGIQKKYSDRLERATNKKKISEEKLLNISKILDTKKEERIDTEKKISEKRDKINKQTSTNVNYIVATRLGPSFFPNECSGVEESSDVSRLCYGKVTSFWWGSISIVIAITGTVVALASEVLRSTSLKSKKPLGGNRSIMVALYKYFRKPRIKKIIEEKIVEKSVEVVKEVPVQKIEYVEVPKIQDVIKKEIVHVPIFTNDESLIDISKKRKNKKSDDESN